MAISPEEKARREALKAQELAFIRAFQKRLVDARERRGCTQQVVATYLGLHISAYKKYENRSTSLFPLFLIPKLGELLEQPHSYWFTGQTVPTTSRRHLSLV